MFVFCECCVLSGRGVYDGPIPRPEESYRVFVCVSVCLSVIEEPHREGVGQLRLSNHKKDKRYMTVNNKIIRKPSWSISCIFFGLSLQQLCNFTKISLLT